MNTYQYQFDFGYEVLGPLIERFCYKIWLSEGFYEGEDSAVLFLARGGLRLRHYYDLFLTKYGLSSNLLHNDLHVSRIAVHKAALLVNTQTSAELIAKEFEWVPIQDTFLAIFGKSVTSDWLKHLPDEEREYVAKERMNAQYLVDIIAGERASDRVISSYVQSHYNQFQEHVQQQSGGRKNLLLVDTGWSGSIIRSIQSLLPNNNVMGCFYGKHSYGKVINEGWYNDIVGLEAEGVRYKWDIPGTSIFLHRHLLEGLCGVDWPSVVGYRRTKSGKVVSDAEELQNHQRAPSQSEGMGQGVNRFLELKRTYEAYECLDSGRRATAKLNRIVIFPGSKDTSLTVEARSADFGKELDVPVLLPPAGRFKFNHKISNIKNSLWTGAQITREFPFLYPMVQLAYYLKMIKGNL